jgi:hypothetical protein
MKLVGMMGTAVVFLTLGCAVSSYAQQEERRIRFDKRLKTEQAQSGLRLQNADSPGVGLMPNYRYRSHFGQEHKFHLSPTVYGKDRRFQYGGYSFGFVDEWPTNWRSTEDVFVIQIEGGYYLCNSTYPGVNIPLNIAP